ncbi:MAG: hypothetical protein BWY70_01312 [Bacteroidetes bacterium ADurb.Bin408]|nr:MAG: hypothetical protein BWY70_01312 [Bacteroidetes bacterium ADurb.Bin408]
MRELAKNDPRLFLKQFKPPLILDEIQYVPELLPYLKIEIDNTKQSGMYWLTGSQHFAMMKHASESLAGRMALFTLLGFSQRELYGNGLNEPPFLPGEAYLNKSFNNDINATFGQIFKGGMPFLNLQKDADRDVYFNSYLQTYILRNLRELTQVADLTKFTRFIKICAARTGQLLNYSNIAQDADVSVQTAKNWLSVLETSFMVYLMQPYYSNLTSRLIKTPKLYFLDTGLCAFLTAWNSPETLMNGAMSGAVFETMVVTEVLKSYWNRGLHAPLFYYRDKEGKEIDMIIENNDMFFPVEVKLSSTVRREWVKHFSVLEKFKKTIGNGAVICLTDRPQFIDAKNLAINIRQI